MPAPCLLDGGDAGSLEDEKHQDVGGLPMPRSAEWNIQEGTEVITADDEVVGRVVSVEEGHLVVEEGRLFPTDHIVPKRAITDVADGVVRLSVTKGVVLERNWDSALPPVESEAPPASEDVEILGTIPVVEGGEEILRIPVHEEELVPRTEERQIGEVSLNKNVLVEDRVVEVPVVEERVRITRHLVDRDPDRDDEVFTEGSLAIPIRGEEVDLTRRTRVVEEIAIAKEAVQVTEEIAGTVRREEVHVDSVEFPTTSAAGSGDGDVDESGILTTPTAGEVDEASEPVDARAAAVTSDRTTSATARSPRSAKRSGRKKR